MRNVEDAHQPVLQVQPERHQGVDAPGDETGGDQFDPGREGHHFQAGLFGFSRAVAIFAGHTTSNSPFCHWPTLPGVPTFSLPSKRMSPRMVLWVVPAT